MDHTDDDDLIRLWWSWKIPTVCGHCIMCVCGDAGVKKNKNLPCCQSYKSIPCLWTAMMLDNDNKWLCFWFLHLLCYSFYYYFGVYSFNSYIIYKFISKQHAMLCQQQPLHVSLTSYLYQEAHLLIDLYHLALCKCKL
jgi:hypothetical protein